MLLLVSFGQYASGSDRRSTMKFGKLFCVATVVVLACSLCAAQTTERQFVYVANSGSNDISAYLVDLSTGILKEIHGSPFVVGERPSWIASDPAGRYVYVTNSNSDNISAYTVASATGGLTQISSSPFKAGERPSSIAVDPTGRFAYVTNLASKNVSAYTISPNGVLVEVIGSPFKAGDYPNSITISPSGKFAYVVNQGGAITLLSKPTVKGNISAYSINSANGALVEIPGSPFTAGDNPTSIAVLPSGKFAYVTNSGSDDISVFRTNPDNGGLTAVIGSPVKSPTRPALIRTDSVGRLAYVVGRGSALADNGHVGAYRIDSVTGNLTQTADELRFNPGKFVTFDWGHELASITTSNKYIFVVDFSSNRLPVYEIDSAAGRLTEVSGSPFKTGTSPTAVWTITSK